MRTVESVFVKPDAFVSFVSFVIQVLGFGYACPERTRVDGRGRRGLPRTARTNIREEERDVRSRCAAARRVPQHAETGDAVLAGAPSTRVRSTNLFLTSPPAARTRRRRRS